MLYFVIVLLFLAYLRHDDFPIEGGKTVSTKLSRAGLVFIIVSLVTMMISACGGSQSGSTGTSSGGSRIAAGIKGLDNPFFQAMEQGIKGQANAQTSDVNVQ